MSTTYWVKHRTAQERAGSGYMPPDLPWTYDGPYETWDAAKAHWDEIRPGWQEGEVVSKCQACGGDVAHRAPQENA